MAPASSTSDWIEHAADRLSDAGYRRGGARRAILELMGSQGCALTAIDIEERLRGSDRVVARATVYRVLEELEGLKLVGRVDVGDGTARYEALHPGGEHHHHHLVCSRCGDLVPFSDDELERVIHEVARRVDFDVSYHDVTLHGSCSGCQSA